MTTAAPDHDGRRIRRLRKLAGYTQAEFAHRMGRSQPWVSGVENGDIPLDSIALIYRAARILRVTANDITASPGVLASPAEERVRAAVTRLRRVIQRWDLPADWPTEPRSPDQLAAAVASLTVLRRRARYAQLGEEVTDVLREIHAAAAAATGYEAEHLQGLLALAYKEADTFAHTVGYDDLATLAIERFRWSAERSADPRLTAIGDFLRVRDLWNLSLFDDALTVIDHRLTALGPDATPDITGSLQLRAAITAARGGDEQRAFDRITEAQVLADAHPLIPDPYGLTFTPANVTIHALSVAVESLDGPRAVQLAANLHLPETTPRSRAARAHLDAARGCVYNSTWDSALAEMERAERLAPLMIRNSRLARAAVDAMLERRGGNERLRRLASRMQPARLGHQQG